VSDINNKDKEAFSRDLREDVAYRQKIIRAKNELRARLPPRMLKRKELWEMNKSKSEVMKINLTQAWRRFDTRSRGMGLMFVLMMSILIMMAIIPMIIDGVQYMFNEGKYREGLKTACLGDMFYSLNFKTCEDIGIRPIMPSQQDKGDSA